MRSAFFVIWACVATLSYAAIIDYYDRGEEECPTGSQCMPASLCPAAAQPALWGRAWPGLGRGVMRQGARCSSVLPGARVCCWSPNALPPPSHRFARAAQAAGSTPSVGTASPSQRACEEYRSLRSRTRRSPKSANTNTGVQFVVGGERAQEAEFPYMVAIGYQRGRSNSSADLYWGCGGSLISDRYVLTAAHCITDAQRQNYRPTALRTGVNTLVRGPQRPDDYSMETITLHPRHHPDRKYFDLALLRADQPVLFSRSEIPVCLPAPGYRLDPAAKLLVAGWGAIDPEGFDMSADLQKAELSQVVLEECKKLIQGGSGLPRGLDDTMICASESNKDTCKGDSGGPLVVREPQGDVLVGVTSFGGRPCAGVRPGVYARVLSELQWIESIVWS